jgi:undecaprenyl-diphosphatase
MLEYLQIVVLALIQSAAELLPVSSSAHVIVAEKLMHLDPSSPKMVFILVMLHTGTMFAVLYYFWPRWRPLLFPEPSAAATQPGGRWHFLGMVVLATIITGLLGLGLQYVIEKLVFEKLLGHSKGEVEDLFKNLPLIAAALFAVGLVIIAAGFAESRSYKKSLSLWSTTLIGIVQGLCLPFRGFSRSGATISTGLFCGVARGLSEDFSFALAVAITPAIIGRSVWRLYKERHEHLAEAFKDALVPGLVGMVVCFIVGLIALRFLSAVLERGQWKYFGIYCLFAALGVLTVWMLGY